MSKKIIAFSLLIIVAAHGLSQTVRSFNEEPENYPAVVAAMFPANVSEADRALIAEFSAVWNDNTFTNREKLDVIRLSNAFLEKRARNIHYWMLWRCLLSFKKSENTGKGYEAWMNAMIDHCQDRRSTPTSLQTLMTATLELLNNRNLFASAGHDWKLSNHNYHYDFTGNELTVVVGNSTISCVSRGDSISIEQTSGRFLVNEQVWNGRGGIVMWERAGFARDEIIARLSDYTINMRRSEYEADSVMLTHKTYFPTPVAGKLTDRLRRYANPEAALYPEFETYHKKFVFNELYPNVNYEGGVSIQGARVIGSGTEEQPAKISIHNPGDSLWVDVKAQSFVFLRDRVNSRQVSLNIRFFGDSIVHTNLSFAYLVGSREVNLFRSDAATSNAPYFNTYHRLTMDFGQIIWRTDEPLMTFSMARGANFGRAQFRSQNYFDQRFFNQIQYLDAVNPLTTIRQVAANSGQTFTTQDFVNQRRTSTSDARVQLINVARLGFILFDSEHDRATVQPHLYEFLDAAARRRDFDVIDLHSQISAPARNATFDTRTYDLLVNGIESFMVSDSQRVVITPRDQRVAIQRNRTFNIDGRIDAGNAEIHGDLMRFDYDEFKIDLSKVDSLYFYVPTGDTDILGRPVMRRLITPVKRLIGSILVDRPDNKSGRFSLKYYPILQSDSLAVVDYDAPGVEGGAYKAESFFFQLDPFLRDSLDKLTRNMVAFDGTFVSAGIFDDMRQTLRVQPDYSLGFVHHADSALSTYKQAELRAEVRLSNRGLEASGRLEYLTTSIRADDFKLYPDSMNVLNAQSFVIRRQTEGVEYPDVNSDGTRIHWTPWDHTMHVFDDNFTMYNPGTRLDGSLVLRPDGLSGKGKMDIENETAELRSDDFDYRANRFTAEQSELRLKAINDGPYRVMTVDSLYSEVDFENRTGRFIPNNRKNFTLVNFPSNNFAGYVDQMTWYMDSAKLHITSVDTLVNPVEFRYAYQGESRGSRYYSTARGADSLSFVSPRSVLDLESGVIKAEGVNLVKTHDAIIYPGKGRLTVNTDGALEFVESAIVFNDNLRQHTVYDATLNVQGRRQFSGSGKYDYVDDTGAPFVVDIERMGADMNGRTFANGVIPAESQFALSPAFRFQGGMSLNSDVRYPEFNGHSQIIHDCDALQTEWFRFSSLINPDSIFIPISDAPVNIHGSRIYNGLFVTNDSIYPALFSVRKTPGDRQMINASGVLTYDRDSMMYFIASPGKLNDRDTVGNLLVFDRFNCLVHAEGKLSLGLDFGRVTNDVTGRMTHNMNTRETTFNVMMSLDFMLDNTLAQMMATSFESHERLTGVDMLRPTFIRGMNEWLGVARSATYRREALLGEVRNFPAELNKTLVLTQLNLFWDHSTRSYRSVGKIGVGNIFGHQINRLVDGMVEITKVSTGDLFHIYLKLDDENWYYFRYTREMMQILSSDKAFNDHLVSIPERRRRMAERRPGYTYMIAAAETYNQFLRQYQQRAVQTMPSQDFDSPVVQPQQPVNVPQQNVPIIEIE